MLAKTRVISASYSGLLEQLAIAGGNAVLAVVAAGVMTNTDFVLLGSMQLGVGLVAGTARAGLTESINGLDRRRNILFLFLIAALGIGTGVTALALSYTNIGAFLLAASSLTIFEGVRPAARADGLTSRIFAAAVAWGLISAIAIIYMDSKDALTPSSALLVWSLPSLALTLVVLNSRLANWIGTDAEPAWPLSSRSVFAKGGAVEAALEFALNSVHGLLLLVLVAKLYDPVDAANLRLSGVFLGALAAAGISRRVGADKRTERQQTPVLFAALALGVVATLVIGQLMLSRSFEIWFVFFGLAILRTALLFSVVRLTAARDRNAPMGILAKRGFTVIVSLGLVALGGGAPALGLMLAAGGIITFILWSEPKAGLS